MTILAQDLELLAKVLFAGFCDFPPCQAVCRDTVVFIRCCPESFAKHLRASVPVVGCKLQRDEVLFHFETRE